jgi:hypothetical protein
MTCKMRSYEFELNELIPEIKWKDFTCEKIRKVHLDLKNKWRQVNGTDEILKKGLRDRVYENYCNEIDDFLFQCRCDPEWIDLHLQEFCDDENKNIMIAKAKRNNVVSEWDKKE